VVGEVLREIANDPEVEAAMFEILEIEKLGEGKRSLTLIPQGSGGILGQLLAAGKP
jgi:hypothetical protein